MDITTGKVRQFLSTSEAYNAGASLAQFIVILVDTNVIIDFGRNPSEALKKIFIEEKVAICGIIKAELMHGARSEKDLHTISEALADFEYISLDESIWDEVGFLTSKEKWN